MRLKRHLKEATEPTVDMATKSLEHVFEKIRSIFSKVDLFDLDDNLALKILRSGFDNVGVKLEMGRKKGSRKYIENAEFGGKYGGDYNWLIRMKPGFSKVFKKFATPRGWKLLEDPNKNPLLRELIEVLSHEIIHTKQAIDSSGAAFDPEIQGIDTTFSGNIKDYLKHPLEIEPHAQQAAIDTIRMGADKSPIIKNYKALFPPGSKVMKTFLKKYAFYLTALKAQGDIKPYNET
jgi:hypothetical protein